MKSWTVNATQEVSYDVRQTDRVLDPGNRDLARAAALHPGARRLVVVDRQVWQLYGPDVRAYFRHQRVDARYVALPTDEPNKTVESVYAVVDAADAAGLNRRSDPIIAIGGGVLTDVVGLAASLYRRGIPFIRVPTTLIGLVDAAVGVKTAINHHSHKNRLGTYFPAATTLLDQSFLRTLPTRHVANGLAEIVKIALVRDRVLFDLLADRAADVVELVKHGGVGGEIIERAVGGMLAELAPNLWEQELRRLVDFGHTFSPGFELNADHPLLHGEAVAVDMVLCCLIAQGRGLLSEDEVRRVVRLLRLIGLPVTTSGVTPDQLVRCLEDATRHRDGHQHLPLPQGLGHGVFVEDVTPEEIHRAHRSWVALDRLREVA
ncbi:sedoheptulose 7-phosphate cyclase [Actinosynnema sp. NPDC047251]|uniref:2-epi-5-epi-valiolone synthase n=2 Tax=Saccharothrix espanaensis TaxID=103731 RepID=K0K7E3_SACES|nr:sedoheptulose 7-phosphate cyclase [Saccharothrix espanaensis]CCH32528.1 putative 2-epi-5-epi-valiolone synthase [Saccharothrix espanaensis DSM 44229]